MAGSRNGRISYEPFLFGIAVIGALFKLYEAAKDGQFKADWLLGAILVIFLVASAMWIYNSRRQRVPTSVNVNVKTGDVRKSNVMGVEATARDAVRANVETGSVVDSSVTGYKEV